MRLSCGICDGSIDTRCTSIVFCCVISVTWCIPLTLCSSPHFAVSLLTLLLQDEIAGLGTLEGQRYAANEYTNSFTCRSSCVSNSLGTSLKPQFQFQEGPQWITHTTWSTCERIGIFVCCACAKLVKIRCLFQADGVTEAQHRKGPTPLLASGKKLKILTVTGRQQPLKFFMSNVWLSSI